MFIFKIEFRDKGTKSGSVPDVPGRLATMLVGVLAVSSGLWGDLRTGHLCCGLPIGSTRSQDHGPTAMGVQLVGVVMIYSSFHQLYWVALIGLV